MEEIKYDVFISYSRKDYMDEQNNEIPGNEISKILQALTAEGISYWIDKEGIEWGADFPEAISSSIASSSILVFISSKNSIESKWVTKEVVFAENRNKYIIPIRLDNTPYNNRLELQIADLNHIDYFKNPEKAIKTLIKSINKQKNEIEQLRQIENSCKAFIEKEISIETDRQKLLHDIDSIQDKNKQVELKRIFCSTNPSESSSNLHKEKEVEKKIASLKSTCEHLSSQIKNKETEINNLKEDNTKLDSNIKNKETEINNLKENNTKLDSIIKNKETEIVNNRKKSNITTAILASLFTMSLLYCLAFPHKTSKPMLLFTGGGSVVNYIDSVFNYNLKKYPNSVYVNQASANAWTLLVEDAFIDGEKPFFPICLSADTIDTNYINAKYSKKENRGYIIGIKLGEDPLVVYIDTLTAQKWELSPGIDSKILVKDLSEKIYNINHINEKKKKKESIIFTTSSNSGTLRAYQNSIKKFHNMHFDEMINDTLSYLFFDESPQSYYKDLKSSLPYIVLGSEFYKPDSLRNEGLTRLFVENEKGRIKKPIYVYFRVNNPVKNETSNYIIEKQIVDFLIKINANKNNDIRQWDNITSKHIVHLDALREFVHYLN